MKKSIILALALALPAMAGDEKSAPVTVVDVPVAAPAPTCSAFGVEVGAVYTAALNDIDAGIDGIGQDFCRARFFREFCDVSVLIRIDNPESTWIGNRYT